MGSVQRVGGLSSVQRVEGLGSVKNEPLYFEFAFSTQIVNVNDTQLMVIGQQFEDS